MLRNRMFSVMVLSGALAIPFAAGCSDTVSDQKTVKVKDDGTVVKKQQTVTENPDGSVTKTEKKTVNKVD